MKKMNQKGFTMAELLIVVAIIAVLVAIAIPIFTTQLEKAKESTDLANLRSAYAEASVAALESDSNTGSATTVAMTQGTAGWLGSNGDAVIGGITIKDDTVTKAIVKGQKITVTVSDTGTTFAVATP